MAKTIRAKTDAPQDDGGAKTKVTNTGDRDWDLGFAIPVGQSLVLSNDQHELYRQNYPAFLEALLEGRLAIELV